MANGGIVMRGGTKVRGHVVTKFNRFPLPSGENASNIASTHE